MHIHSVPSRYESNANYSCHTMMYLVRFFKKYSYMIQYFVKYIFGFFNSTREVPILIFQSTTSLFENKKEENTEILLYY